MKKYHAVFFTDLCTKTWHMKSLGPYRLASELRKKNYNVLVVDYFSKWFLTNRLFKKLIDTIITNETLFVAYSGTFFSKDNQLNTKIKDYRTYFGGTLTTWPVETQKIYELNSYIRKQNPNCRILYGGAQANKLNEDLTESGIDYVIDGPADSLITVIAEQIQNRQELSYAKQFKKIKIIKQSWTQTDFDINNAHTYYDNSDHVEKTETLPLETARGCMFKCKFCAYPLIGRKKGDPNYHKNQTVLTSELRKNYDEFGVTKYTIVDDTFNESTDKLNLVYESIRDSGLDLEFSGYIRLDLLERFPEQIDLLKKIGLKSAFLGIESLNEKAAKAIGKTSKVERVKKTLSMMHDKWGDDVRIFGSFIAGLPHENTDTINDWMQWVYDHDKLIHNFILNTLHIDPTRTSLSEIAREPEKYGYICNGMDWINNMGLDSQQARSLSNYWMEKSWNDGRLKIAGWEALGMQNLGYDLDYLKKFSLNKLPYDKFALRYLKQFRSYQKFLFDHCIK